MNSLRYCGYYYDSDTDLYYLQNRYYDPTTLRFISADRITDTMQGLYGTNMYAYCLNNPVGMQDDNGYKAKSKSKSESLPKKGKPGEVKTLYNPDGTPKQERIYGPDGNPLKDIDYNHGGVGHVFPHEHEWINGVRQDGKQILAADPKPCPTPSPNESRSTKSNINTSKVVSGTATGVGIGTIIYWLISEGTRVVPARNLIPIL